MQYPVSFNLDLKRNPYKGLYIAIEGIDGCGKTTQIENLKSWFEEKGKSVVVTSEPRKEKSIVGKLIRELLENKIKLTPLCFQDLYSAERAINHESVVISELKKGNVVLSHRCFWSAVAYGIFDKGEWEYSERNSNIVMVANGIFSHYYQFIAPDFTFYLSVGPKTAMKRIKKMRKKKEIYEEKEKLSRVIAGYKFLLQKFPKEIIMVSGEQEEERVTKQIISNVKTQMSNLHLKTIKLKRFEILD